ncbi:SGM_3592 family protein [Streptomyces apocyni]|uniref:SGM_3592 family protein n=1 Tax=Streptomyces apocyni TaxID=2654677 RepID=UPI0012EA053B|nr:hypothetical protein [Streptomyces apocyni]
MAPEPTPRDGRDDDNDRDDWDDTTLDEDFVRSAKTSEPSARNRMLTARWRKEGPPGPQPWRSDEPPAGWFWSRARKRWWKRRHR